MVFKIMSFNQSIFALEIDAIHKQTNYHKFAISTNKMSIDIEYRDLCLIFCSALIQFL